MLFPILGPSTSSLPVVVVQPDERHANRTAFVLEWTDTGQSTTSGSNEVVVVVHKNKIYEE